MVGDSLKADIEGALAAGMRACCCAVPATCPPTLPAGVPVIHALTELPAHLLRRRIPKSGRT